MTEGACSLTVRNPNATSVWLAQPKAGTTWTQQIVHHLRCRAAGLSVDQASAFEEISCVVPFIEMALDIGIDPHAEQVALPRFAPHASRRPPLCSKMEVYELELKIYPSLHSRGSHEGLSIMEERT